MQNDTSTCTHSQNLKLKEGGAREEKEKKEKERAFKSREPALSKVGFGMSRMTLSAMSTCELQMHCCARI